jgi:hypothetical protein
MYVRGPSVNRMTRMVDDFLAYDAEQGPGPP